MWSSRELVRHLAILALCFAQKQLWYRSQRLTSRRPRICPRWLRRHADTMGVHALLVVAVARHHFWSIPFAMTTVPWLFRRNPSNAEQQQRWLRIVRCILLVFLLGQVSVRLGVDFGINKWLDPSFEKVCHLLWENVGQEQCVKDWQAWVVVVSLPLGMRWLWEFLALFTLGLVQHLLDRTSLNESRKPRDAALVNKKNRIMHWWPSLVWLLCFLLSLSGGTILGICHLLMLFVLIIKVDSPLCERQRWVWRTRLCAWVFLFLGLATQSPLCPCSRAHCANKTHRVFMPRTMCFHLEELNVAEVATNSGTDKCDESPSVDALGHDIWLTLLMQVMGLRRVEGESFEDGFRALFGSQLGLLLALVLVATVQLSIYNSCDYKDFVARFHEEGEEGKQLRAARARRYALEFYCAGDLEASARKERKRALRGMLKRSMNSIGAILQRTSNALATSAQLEQPFRVAEEVQLNQGVTKQIAAVVTGPTMFRCNVEVSKQYLDILQQVAIGRLRKEVAMELGKRLFEQLGQHMSLGRGVGKEEAGGGVDYGIRKLANLIKLGSVPTTSPQHEGDVSNGSLARPRCWKQVASAMDSMLALAKAVLETLVNWWQDFRCGLHLNSVMFDYPFLGVDEVTMTLREPVDVEDEELNMHRRENGLFRILWKMMLSKALRLIAAASILSFIQHRSVLDALRIGFVFMVALRAYPFPPRLVLTILKYYSVAVLALRTCADMPISCGGPSLRAYMTASERREYYWEPNNTFAWCPAVSMITPDVIIGFPKRSGASVIETSTRFFWGWADHFCIWSVVMHIWMLKRSGLWEYIQVDYKTQTVWVKTKTPSHELAEPASPESESNLRSRKIGEMLKFSKPGVRLWGITLDNPTSFIDVHKQLVAHCDDARIGFIRRYKEAARRRQKKVAKQQSNTSLSRVPEYDERERLSLNLTGPHHNRCSPTCIQQAQVLSKLATKVHGALGLGDEGSKQAAHLLGLTPDYTGVENHDLAARKIQQRFRLWSYENSRHSAIRCEMGHRLQQVRGRPFDERQIASLQAERNRQLPNQAAGNDVHLPATIPCDLCWRNVIGDGARWTCEECDYHMCDDCVQEFLKKGLGVGKQSQGAAVAPHKRGKHLYMYKYLCGLILLGFVLLGQSTIEGERSFSDSIKNNHFSVNTLLLLIAHFSMLLSDRIFHKFHYTDVPNARTLEILLIFVQVMELVVLHALIISSLASSRNPREARINLSYEKGKCLYYVTWMIYLYIGAAQTKYGLPAIDHDLRRMKDPESQGVIMEQISNLSFLIHYNLPFVDDIRVIIDWTVMPTSLDLWMYFKVEDANNWLYRTRHLMFVRRESYFAERRTTCEKCYNGWALIALLAFVILLPIIIFSEITPFNNMALISTAEAELRMVTASPYTKWNQAAMADVLLYKASAKMISEVKSEEKDLYLEAHPTVSTDINIQEIMWPADSHLNFDIAPSIAKRVESILDSSHHGNVTKVVFELRIHVDTTPTNVRRSTSFVACYCAPSSECFENGNHHGLEMWPPGIPQAEPSGTPQQAEKMFHTTRAWWKRAMKNVGGDDDNNNTLTLEGFLSSRIEIGKPGEDVVPKDEERTDLEIGLMDESGGSDCSFISPNRARNCWLRASLPSQLKVTYEVVRFALSPINSGSYGSVVGLYLAVVLVAGRYLRATFQDASKRAIYEEIPDVGLFLDLVVAVRIAREHGDLRTELQLYYCMTKVLRSTAVLLDYGGHEVSDYGVCRTDPCPPECVAPFHLRSGEGALRLPDHRSQMPTSASAHVGSFTQDASPTCGPAIARL